MQIEITFIPYENKLSLPLPYNQVIQGFIYNHLDQALSSWLHDEAYQFNKRRFKLFVFGRLTGTYSINNKRIDFQGPVKLSVRSVNDQVISSFAQYLLDKRQVILGRTPCLISQILIVPDPGIDPSKPIQLRALSPVTIYSTLNTFDGRKKTYYYSPTEPDWEVKILENLIRKGRAIGRYEDMSILDDAWIKPKHLKNSHMKILKFKGTVIKGWMGTYQAFLPEELFFIGYNGGFGAKNSQGFGMMEIVDTP